MSDNNKKIKFSVENVEFIESDIDKSTFAVLKVDAFATGKSAHDTFVSEETLKRTAHTILMKPFVFDVDKRFDDMGTHSQKEVVGGIVPHNSPIEFKTLEDGRIMMSCIVLIWRKYCGDLLRYFSESGNKKNVSVEIEVFEEKEDPKTGLRELLDYTFDAITGLGDLVRPAINSAQAILQFSKEYNEAYNLEFSRYEGIDFNIPDSVKSNAQQGLNSYKQFYKGATPSSLSTARHLLKNKTSSPEKIRNFVKYFEKHKIDDLENKESNQWVSWCLMGGNECWEWARDVLSKIDKVDGDHMSYFGEILTFPYKSLKDVNPSIRGIDPPVSLSQANAIAAQADAIGVTEKKNGWAISISQFKKSHTIVDGKWVVKKGENNNMEDEVKDKEKTEEEVKENMAEKPKEEETPEGEKSEEMAVEEPKKEEEKPEPESKTEEKMSLDWNADTAAFLALLEDETEQNRAIASEEFAKPENERNFAKIAQLAYCKMCRMAEKIAKMEEDGKAYMAEIGDLRKFKASIDEEKKKFAVEDTLRTILENSIVPEDKITEMRSESEKFSVEDIDIWKNNCKAIAFDCPKVEKKSKDKDDVQRYANPWADVNKKKSLWDD